MALTIIVGIIAWIPILPPSFEGINALSFYLVGPKWFWSDQIDLPLTIMIWSRPKWSGQDQIVIFYKNESQFGPDQFILVVTISFGIPFILVVTKL